MCGAIVGLGWGAAVSGRSDESVNPVRPVIVVVEVNVVVRSSVVVQSARGERSEMKWDCLLEGAVIVLGNVDRVGVLRL